MKYIIVLFFTVLVGFSANSQKDKLSDYSYVIVPEKFEFFSEEDKYQLNTMALFYFKKYGFNAYLANDAPISNECDGLYADVEEEKSLLWTKLQIVLRDCNGSEIYRSEVGRSKYKDYEKSYPDALRRTFENIEALRIKQKEIVLLEIDEPKTVIDSLIVDQKINPITFPKEKVTSEMFFPSLKYSNYTQNGKSYLLRKTAEGYSLYEENTQMQDGLELLGKIIVLNNIVKYMDITGNISDVLFESSGNFVIENKTSGKRTFKLID